MLKQSKDDTTVEYTKFSKDTDIPIIPDDADDLSVIYEKNRRGSQDAEDSSWSRSVSPRSMLSLSACWTQTTNNTFDVKESPLPFIDMQFDDRQERLTPSSVSSRALLNVSPTKRKQYMNSNLRAELATPMSEISNCSVISASPSVMTNTTLSSRPKNDLNDAMIRGDSFITVTPELDGDVESTRIKNTRNSSPPPLSDVSAFIGLHSKSTKKTTTTSQNDVDIFPEYSSLMDKHDASIDNMNTSLSTIQTTNTVTTLNTTHTLNLSVGTSDHVVYKHGRAQLQIPPDFDANDSDVITPLSTCSSVMTKKSVLNRAFFGDDENENVTKGFVETEVQSWSNRMSEGTVPMLGLERQISDITVDDNGSQRCSYVSTDSSSFSTDSNCNAGILKTGTSSIYCDS